MASGGVDDNLSDETFDFLCTRCKHGGKNKEAVKYCTDCSDYYCKECVEFHDTMPVLKGHKTVDKGQFKKGATGILPMVPTERCARHGLKPVDMYCENHDNVGCATCMVVEHKLCQGMYYVPEYLQKTGSTTASTRIQSKLDSTEQTLENCIRQFREQKQETLERKSESIQSLRKFRKEIDTRLDELEQASIAEIEGKYKVLIEKVEAEIQLATQTKNDITSARGKLISAGSNASQAFVSSKMCNTVLMDANKYLSEKLTGGQKEETSFKAEVKLSNLLNELQALGATTQYVPMKAQGSYRVSGKQQHAQYVPMKAKGSYMASGNQQHARLQAKGMKKYNVKDQSDSNDCSIKSACVLEDGTVILADHSNNKLKRLNKSTYRVTDHYNLPGRPWQVCATNQQEVAVSYHEEEIMFISIGNKMTQKSIINTDFGCFGLAFTNGNLYISDLNTSVYIYNTSGHKLKQFSKDQSGQRLFSDINSLTVSKDGSRIYVTDYNNGLIVLDNAGHVVGRYSDSKLKLAYGAHLTSNGSVLVCWLSSNNVVQFGPDGELIGEVIKSDGGDSGCQTVCCNQQMTKMIVGRMRDEIEVYDLV